MIGRLVSGLVVLLVAGCAQPGGTPAVQPTKIALPATVGPDDLGLDAPVVPLATPIIAGTTLINAKMRFCDEFSFEGWLHARQLLIMERNCGDLSYAMVDAQWQRITATVTEGPYRGAMLSAEWTGSGAIRNRRFQDPLVLPTTSDEQGALRGFEGRLSSVLDRTRGLLAQGETMTENFALRGVAGTGQIIVPVQCRVEGMSKIGPNDVVVWRCAADLTVNRQRNESGQRALNVRQSATSWTASDLRSGVTRRAVTLVEGQGAISLATGRHDLPVTIRGLSRFRAD
ncbi:hypothetical protein [Elioraea rosea]|uniref:hypothetical protein n=1 Tax=Elioraea rosea TaxID=2492390 RepID=UPI0011820B8C|nr:hypothetical protein [Elioraea rosea]